MTMQYRTKAVLTLTAVAGLMVALSGSLQADAVIYEPFDYDPGNLRDNNGGTGFAGAWTSTRNNPQVDAGSKTWGAWMFQETTRAAMPGAE